MEMEIGSLDLYTRRFSPADRERKQAIWRILCQDFFQRYIRPSDTVLDLGAGDCLFINHIRCGTKIAVDLRKETLVQATPDIRVLITSCSHLEALADASVDVVFVSNLFEHLPSREEFIKTLQEVQRVLRSGGRLLVLQPNIRFLGGEYWDFLDHRLPLTDRTLTEAFDLVELEVVEVRPRFLPYTTKSRLPQHPWLVRFYLRLRLAQRLLGKQAWVVALKP
jgi:ubiquinone/menaquinone biosynthesis C-methylase UbiE